jgi:hypothetical protein
MKLNVMFTVAAFFLTLIGILSLLAPAFPALAETDANGNFGIMGGGASTLSLGVIAWLVRNAEASKMRDSVVLGYTILFALFALVSFYGQFFVPGGDGSWVNGLIWILFTVGFFMAGKSSMSKSAS